MSSGEAGNRVEQVGGHIEREHNGLAGAPEIERLDQGLELGFGCRLQPGHRHEAPDDIAEAGGRLLVAGFGAWPSARRSWVSITSWIFVRDSRWIWVFTK